jgi:predicted unusual protein kinase regulating ubiquinone biosynthesis (AarF/ABC1/UbiB family)
MTDRDRLPASPEPLPVPGGRLQRLAAVGALASGVAGSMMAEGVRRLARGERPQLGDLLLTPANARRVADQLARLRGAAMKVGQLLSMDAGDHLPAELTAILAALRADARAMPMSQVVAVLEGGLGKGWQDHFAQFSFTPMAAASIGQVHRGRLKDGREVAVKIQYPGVRRSIDSDVANVAGLLRLSGLLPRGIDLEPLLAEARRQLHAEADYRQEAAHIDRFARLLAGDPGFALPAVVGEVSGETVLCMTFVPGAPIEALAGQPAAERDHAVTRIFALLFRELFEFGLLQTDPNFANYRYDTASGRVGLLDFGATRTCPPEMVLGYRDLLDAGCTGERTAIEAAARRIGYFGAAMPPARLAAVVDLFRMASEPLRHDGPYDFGRSDLSARISRAGMALGRQRDFWHTPPADALFLHRKMGGLYLLAARLGARVDAAAMWRGVRGYAGGQALGGT